MLITPAWAQAAGGSSIDMLQGVAPFALIFVVFYFFLIRPQQQKAKQLRATLDALRRGDRVVTGGGIIGTVSKVVSNDEVQIEIADNVRVRVVRGTITQLLARTEPVAAKDDKDTKDGEDAATTSPKTAAEETPMWKKLLGLR